MARATRRLDSSISSGAVPWSRISRHTRARSGRGMRATAASLSSSLMAAAKRPPAEVPACIARDGFRYSSTNRIHQRIVHCS